MLQSSIIEDLLRQMAAEPDEARRVELAREAKDRYFKDMEYQTNFVQQRVSDLEIVLQDQLTQSLGNTNDMVSGLVEDGRQFRRMLEEYFVANTATMEGLRTETQAGFRDTYQQIGTIGERVTGIEVAVAEHDRIIEDFRQSRERSIRERDELRAQFEESREDRAGIHRQLAAIRQQLDTLLAREAGGDEQ